MYQEKPEYADNIELGIAKHIGSFMKFDVTAYYTHLDDAIVRRDFLFNGSSTMEYQGASLLLARGFSLNATLENIADRRYRPYSCGISAPGRKITMSLTCSL